MRRQLTLFLIVSQLLGCFPHKPMLEGKTTSYSWIEKGKEGYMIHVKTYGDLTDCIQNALVRYYSDTNGNLVVDTTNLNKEVNQAFIYIGRNQGIVSSGQEVSFPAPRIR